MTANRWEGVCTPHEFCNPYQEAVQSSRGYAVPDAKCIPTWVVQVPKGDPDFLQEHKSTACGMAARHSISTAADAMMYS